MAVIDVRWLTVFIDRPAATFEACAEFWRLVTGATLSSRRGEHGEFATLLPPTGDPHVRVQRVTDGRGGTHIDVHVAGDLGAACDRAAAVGAEVISRLDDVVVMSSPGGLSWCLVGHHGHYEESAIAGPYAIDGGPATGVDQVCVDVAPDRFDEECAFWATLTGWELRPTPRPEFVFLTRPDLIPMRVLLQRLDDGHDGHAFGAHLDLYSADADQAAQQHVRLGATIVAEFPWWIVMADPSGVTYCLIRRSPQRSPS